MILVLPKDLGMVGAIEQVMSQSIILLFHLDLGMKVSIMIRIKVVCVAVIIVFALNKKLKNKMSSHYSFFIVY
jgi:hypothetical protein